MGDYRQKVRRAILEQTSPFCMTDLIRRLSQKGLNDKGVIVEELNELFECGLIKYGAVEGHSDKKNLYAFYIRE